jgi:uncharacterized protein YigE (DUF2233 family)
MKRLIFAIAIALTACADDTNTSPVTLVAPTVLIPTVDSLVTSAPPAPSENTWRVLKPGIETTAFQTKIGELNESFIVARIDPKQATIRVLYEPQSPKTVRDWFGTSRADVVINAGFFLESKETTGLLIADGKSFGKSYRGFGGMFALRGQQASLQWLRVQPYRADQRITQAVQGFPMLVANDKVPSILTDNGERNRRSFVAIDRQGRVLLGITQLAAMTLTDLAKFLELSQELDVRDALNLDGGASSGLWMGGDFDSALADSFEAVPSVVVVDGH